MTEQELKYLESAVVQYAKGVIDSISEIEDPTPDQVYKAFAGLPQHAATSLMLIKGTY